MSHTRTTFWVVISAGLLVGSLRAEPQEKNDVTGANKHNKLERPGFLIDITAMPEDEQFGKVSFYKEFHLPPSSISEIAVNLDKVKNADDFGFAILQIHAFVYNVSMSFNNAITNGTNLGVVMRETGKINVFNPIHYTEVHVAVISVLYQKNAPIPGDCHLDGRTSWNATAAMINVIPIGEMINQAEALLASDSGTTQDMMDASRRNCLVDPPNYEFYYRFMLQGDQSARTYFKWIRGMLEVARIKMFGSRAPKRPQGDDDGPTKRRWSYIAPAGTGILVNVIVRNNRGMSVSYIPTVSYSCHPLWRKNDCHIIPHSIEWVIPAILLIVIGTIRVFVVLQNHLPNLFFNTFPMGMYFAICLIAVFDDLEKVGRTGIILASGLAIALIFCVTSSKFRVADLVLDITSKLIVSWIIAICVLFLLNDNPFFGTEWIYWSTFFAIITLVFLTTLPFCRIVPIVAHVCTGMNAILFGAQILLQSNMLLIVLNHLHWLKDARYRIANGVPRPSAEDLAIFAAMPALTGVGIFFQIKKIIVCGQKSPAEVPSPIPTEITRWDSGSDDVFESPQTNRRWFLTTLDKRRGYRPFD